MMPSDIKRKLREAIRRYRTDWRSDVKEVAKYQIDTITKQYPEEAATIKRFEGYRDSKMTKNSLMNFIDSCVGNIARKIEDEFRESDHPRDKGGKFTSKGNEGRGGGADDDEFVRQWARKEALEKGRDLSEVDKKFFTNEPKSKVPKRKYDSDEEELVSVSLNRGDSESAIVRALEALGYDKSSAKELIGRVKSSSSKPAKKVDAKASRHIHQVLEDEIRQIAENSDDKDEFKINLGAFLEDYVTDDMADTDERAMDNFGYDKETVHAVAEEMKGEIDSIADDFFEEEEDDDYVYSRLANQDNEIDILNSLKNKGYSSKEAKDIIYKQLKKFK